MKFENKNQEIEILEDSVTIRTKKEDNHSIGELEQKIINYLYNLKYYDSNDAALVKELFNKKRLDSANI